MIPKLMTNQKLCFEWNKFYSASRKKFSW